MKLFSDCYPPDEDTECKIGINWYRHHRSHKWFGFTVTLYILFRVVNINFVSDWKEYDKRINGKRNKK